ncbi:helix-turn-helix domain-containing protein [Enterocloster lavalensis]|uniref:helix-turn-helix domain-containing protein n=1 Tax=Enterocloster lavalensis TaxID=460384 RepID=UPI001D0937F9|nr:helix-turn-helix domain-containing protein [Enterocloster lavalensis]MCB6347068.1 helix-turn-helix domain-containing protein [Enterocloster lavalensis]
MTDRRKKRLPLQTVYYTSFLGLVVVPIVVVLIISLTVLNQVFSTQAVENINRAQEAVASELESDIEQISMRLSHMVYANDNELLSIAAAVDTEDADSRYENQQRLNEAASYATEPVKDIVAVAFYMKDDSKIFFKNEILLPLEEMRREKWYQTAVEGPDRVVVGSYDTNDTRLYSGGTRDSFVLVAALSPDVRLDRSEKIETVTFFQATGASDKIKSYNTGYGQKKNKIGYTRIVDGSGNVVYQPEGIPDGAMVEKGHTRVLTPLAVYGNDWYVESYVRTADLTSDYWSVAGLLLLATTVVLTLFTVFSRYFLKRIIQPVQQMSRGLRQVEEGVLDVHLTPAGQYEVRAMIHSFNAMVRRLKALIADYEERVRQGAKTMPDYLHALVRGEISPGEVRSQAAEFFSERYLLMVVTVGKCEAREGAASRLPVELAQGFDTIPRFASRCTLAVLTPYCFLVYYRIREEDFSGALHDLVRDMKRFAKSKTGAELSFCLGRAQSDCLKFAEQLEEVMDLHDLYMLKGEGSVLDFNQCFDQCGQIARLAPEFAALAAALYIADEKTISQEKEILFRQFQSLDMEEAGNRVLAVILATARQFSGANADFFEIFGEKIDYFEKIGRISDGRSLRLWVTNYCSWVADYSRGRLDVSRADAVTRAKHYVIEHYQNPSLTLKEVADYVDLSEKYFTTKFTKECGETFLSYLTGLRIQKAKELIKTTTFKMYEIAEMVGYNNPEHFNRTFRKLTGMSPAQYRKAPVEEERGD